MPKKILVTGSAGHLGEALVRTLRQDSCEVIGLDIRPSPFTTAVGSITDRGFVRSQIAGVREVYHAATLHKPHVVTHSMQDFVDTNVHGTLVLLEEAVAEGVRSFVFTSTTSVFGDALHPAPGEPAVWVTEHVTPIPKNIYGVTKLAAESLCQLFHRKHNLNCIVLRTSRFFPEQDDNKAIRLAYDDENAKTNEFLFRRVDLEDVVTAHRLACDQAPTGGFRRYIVSATTPFLTADLARLQTDAPAVVRERVSDFEPIYRSLGWKMFDKIERVYVNDAARNELNWQPKYDFQYVLHRLDKGLDPRSPIANIVGPKRYHCEEFADDPYPVE